MKGQQEFRQIRLPEPGEIIDGRYRLGESFARGGMGVIMRTEQLQAGRDVAIKFLHPHVAAKDNIAARFKREVEVTTLFDHPSIVRVYDVGESDKGLLYLVMELLEGEELKEISRREGPMAQGRAVEIMMQMLDGLAEAHSRGIIHRDIKLSNIFIVPNRRGEDNVKLLDFGIAKLISGGKALTSTGTFTGTPSYVAPEALLNTGVSEKSIDVYAAGLVLLEMLTGRKVFDGGGIPQTIMLHLKNPVRIPRRIQDSALGEIICRATMKHPAERYVDADAMYMAIKAIYGDISRDLCLEADEIPPPYRKTPNFLMEIASAIPPSSVDALRELPQHEVYGGGSHQQDQGEPGWQDSVGHTEVDREIRPGNKMFFDDDKVSRPSDSVPLTGGPTRPMNAIEASNFAPISTGPTRPMNAIEGGRVGAQQEVQPPKVEPPKVEPPKVEPPKVQPPKVQPPKVQTLKLESVEESVISSRLPAILTVIAALVVIALLLLMMAGR